MPDSPRASTGRLRRPPSPSPLPVRRQPSPCRGIPSVASLLAEDISEQTADSALVAPTASRLEDAAGGAGERKGLQRHVTGSGHVYEEEPFAAEQTLLDVTLHLHLVPDGRLDHHHAARIDDERLSVGE